MHFPGYDFLTDAEIEGSDAGGLRQYLLMWPTCLQLVQRYRRFPFCDIDVGAELGITEMNLRE